MKKKNKTIEELSIEIKNLKQRIKILEKSEIHSRHAEGQLRKLNAFLRNILESSTSISIISTDYDQNVLYWNRGAEKIFGYKASEMIGKQKISILYPDDNSQKTINDIRTAIYENKEGINCELKELDKKGNQLWINLTLTPRLDDGGNVIGILGIGEDVTEHKWALEELKNSLKKVKTSTEGIIHAMAKTVESRDPYTAGHQKRVANFARTIAREMGLPEEQVEGIYLAGVIHDLGKISVPAEILSNPGNLSDIQFGIIKTHPQAGSDILRDIEFPWPIAQMILQHHEMIDGSGYPYGLKDKKILLESKILAVADVVEAMASHRPYRAALGIDEAINEISQNKGILYDPAVVDACLKISTQKGFKLE